MKNSLQRLFPGLTKFSDIDWDAVSKEYETTSVQISFPEYLQIKAEQGDCPDYVVELAFFEMAAQNAIQADTPFPIHPGIYLNPTALFLSLQYDIPRMLEEAESGEINVHEKEHVLCLYRSSSDEVNLWELTDDDLHLLQELEDGAKPDTSFVQNRNEQYSSLVEKGIILDLS